MLKDCMELLASKVLLEYKDLLVLLVIKGSVGVQGAKSDCDERGERGMKGDKGIQGDISNVLDVLAKLLPIQLMTRYGEKMCFIKYHVSQDMLSIIELTRGVGMHGILMLNLSVVKGQHTESDWSWSFFRVEVPLSL